MSGNEGRRHHYIMPITIQGVEEIKAKLDTLSNEKTKIAIQRAGIRAAAKILLAAQEQTVPFETGRLEGTLGVQIKKQNGKLNALIGPDKKLNFIGRFHEFGTMKMTGTHWMQKAFDSSVQEALAAYTEAVLRLFDKHMYADLVAAIEQAANASEGEE
jgi:HK97 gp10 family phage protein